MVVAMILRFSAFIRVALIGLWLSGCSSDPKATTAQCDGGKACAGAAESVPNASSAAPSDGPAAGRGAREPAAGTGTPRDTQMSSAADSCSAPSCGSDGDMKCVGGQVSRCTLDKRGCSVWQLDRRCARGCDGKSPACAPEMGSDAPEEDAGPNDDAGQKHDSGTKPSSAPTLEALEQAHFETQPLAAVAGVYATPAPEQSGLLISADLGPCRGGLAAVGAPHRARHMGRCLAACRTVTCT